MSADFSNISILGAGLLGGSLALALKELKPAPNIRLWARRQETVNAALGLGIEGATKDLHEAVTEADLLVLSVPVGSMPALVSQSLEAGLPASCLVTDVGSVKRTPHHGIAPLLPKGMHFIGSHPMAGSERNGLDAASANLFQNAACLLTNDENAPSERAAALERFWQTIGCRTTWMTAVVHDELVARISHLPHVIASCAARVCIKFPEEGRFGGGGLRDTTRVAAGNPHMWTEILLENREALLAPLREIIDDLQGLLTCIESGDHENTFKYLETAKLLRDTLNQSA
jgi:prephenate dehydrogenase